MKKSISIITLFLLLISNNLFACERNFYIISDFDDTIKTYKSHGPISFGFQAVFKRKLNAGFDVLYQAMIQENSFECKNESLFTVLTASPTIIEGAITSFLKKYDFPAAKLITRPLKEKTLNYKVDRVTKESRRIFDPLILIGDDTSKDAHAYKAFSDQYPERVMQVYIHNVKNLSPIEGQIKYLTAFDIAYNEYLNGRISHNAVIKVGNAILHGKDEEIIPPYGYCPTSIDLRAESSSDHLNQLEQIVAEKIIAICKSR